MSEKTNTTQVEIASKPVTALQLSTAEKKQNKATGLLYIGKSLLSVNLALNDADGALVDAVLTELLLILSDNGLTTVNSQ